MECYRVYILGIKRNGFVNYDKRVESHVVKGRRVARSLVHYKEFIQEYLAAKRDVLRGAS